MVFFFFNWVQSSCCASHLWPLQTLNLFVSATWHFLLWIVLEEYTPTAHIRNTNDQAHMFPAKTSWSRFSNQGGVTSMLCHVLEHPLLIFFALPAASSAGASPALWMCLRESQQPGSRNSWCEWSTMRLCSCGTSNLLPRDKSQVLWKSTKLLGYKFHKNRDLTDCYIPSAPRTRPGTYWHSINICWIDSDSLKISSLL